MYRQKRRLNKRDETLSLKENRSVALDRIFSLFCQSGRLTGGGGEMWGGNIEGERSREEKGGEKQDGAQRTQAKPVPKRPNSPELTRAFPNERAIRRAEEREPRQSTYSDDSRPEPLPERRPNHDLLDGTLLDHPGALP